MLSFLIFVDIDYLIASLISNDAYRYDTLYTLSGRTEVWPVAIEKILDEPWFGNGLQFDRTYKIMLIDILGNLGKDTGLVYGIRIFRFC